MADTARDKAALLALLADNTSGDISPQDMRDVLVSILGYAETTSVATSTHDVVDADHIIHVAYTTTGVVTVRVMSDQVVKGRAFTIKDAGGNASANNISVTSEGAETFDGAASVTMSTDHEILRLYSDGTNWFKW